MWYKITAIDYASFPPGCQPHLSKADLPHKIQIASDRALTVAQGDFIAPCYRSDAAAGGILAHSPYCECVYEH